MRTVRQDESRAPFQSGAGNLFRRSLGWQTCFATPKMRIATRLATAYHQRRGCQPEFARRTRSEEHTSELQSHSDLVCRLLLEKKKKMTDTRQMHNDTHELSILDRAALCHARV